MRCGRYCSTAAVISGRILIGVVIATLLACVVAAQSPQISRLKFIDNPKLLDCEPVTSAPCFQVRFSALAPDGNPLHIPALTPAELVGSLSVGLGDRSEKPFFANLPMGPASPTVEAKEIVATFASPWPDRASLETRAIHFRVRMKLPAGEELESDETAWYSPEIGKPAFEGRCDAQEGEALLRSSFAGGGKPWLSMTRPVLVFAGCGVALLILWFWVPPLIWRNGYADVIAEKERARWAGAASGGHAAPAGFEQPRKSPVDAAGAPKRLEHNSNLRRDRQK